MTNVVCEEKVFIEDFIVFIDLRGAKIIKRIPITIALFFFFVFSFSLGVIEAA